MKRERGKRSFLTPSPKCDEEHVTRLLRELSLLREHHESLQRQHRDEENVVVFNPDTFGNNAVGSSPKSTQKTHEFDLHLGDGDKDAIEAMFSRDDFTEVFNAGGNVSRVPVTHSHVSLSRPNRWLPETEQVVPHNRCFDPSKPTRRR